MSLKDDLENCTPLLLLELMKNHGTPLVASRTVLASRSVNANDVSPILSGISSTFPAEDKDGIFAASKLSAFELDTPDEGASATPVPCASKTGTGTTATATGIHLRADAPAFVPRASLEFGATEACEFVSVADYILRDPATSILNQSIPLHHPPGHIPERLPVIWVNPPSPAFDVERTQHHFTRSVLHYTRDMLASAHSELAAVHSQLATTKHELAELRRLNVKNGCSVSVGKKGLRKSGHKTMETMKLSAVVENNNV
jgi:hypothetical protein